MKRRLTAIFLCLCLLFTLLPATALAEGETDGVPSPAESALCEHHPQHDGSCGYTEGSAGTPCAHAHSGDCYAPAQALEIACSPGDTVTVTFFCRDSYGLGYAFSIGSWAVEANASVSRGEGTLSEPVLTWPE